MTVETYLALKVIIAAITVIISITYSIWKWKR